MCHYVVQMSPFLSPLDKELVKVILKLLRSSAFLGTAQLLAAIASTDPDTRVPVGLLKVGVAVHGRAAYPCPSPAAAFAVSTYTSGCLAACPTATPEFAGCCCNVQQAPYIIRCGGNPSLVP